MNYLFFENVSKTYGDKVLLDNIDLNISKGDKIGLVAKNGSGKTTLLRIISGEESPEGENAKILFKTDINTVFLKQEPEFDKGITVLDAVFDVDEPKLNAIKEYESALIRKDNSAMEEAVTKIENLKAWNIESKIKEILFRLKVPDLDKQIDKLSGGQKKRVALARIIVTEPDFLILDEPTNHLDIEMIEWLENYLSDKKITLFMVTHDRYFLENTCNRIVELDRGKLISYSGNYEKYLEKKAERVHNENINREKSLKLFKKELEWLKRQPKARTTKSKARSDRVWEIKEKATQTIYNDSITINIETERLGNKILELHNVQKSFGDIKILNEFSYKFKKFEKVGIVGDNGAGKTTFINLLTGAEKPDAGKVILGETLKFGIFSQGGLALESDKRVIEVIRDIAEYLPMSNGKKLTAEQLLEKFLFDRKHQQVYVSQLSGGEKRRLQLLTVLMRNPNFLILDEPTNDLDIITLNILEDYLIGFKGNLIIITHDRYFMDKLTDHLFIMDGAGNIKDYNGTYTRYRLENKNTSKKQEKNEDKRIEVEQKNAIRKTKKKLENEISKTLREIEKREAEKQKIMNFFEENSDADTTKINDMSQKLDSINEEIATLESQWENAMEKLEEVN